ncbi:syndecan isoform X2 [Hylaeus anthracinus]|uniref:syndecan isoform X2 n=1 Tax=Hylaeus volcanicus TaxID=313075 RepID=UPI0023B859E5|nr:syndecan isoform X2 [Hylaeus volcanicus]XP_053999240.1 syndecan isoform X2 [Hylaeus anthracinus]
MQPRIYWILISTAVILAGCNAATEDLHEKERTVGGSSTFNPISDDLYLDDQGPLEGSGRGGNEGRDDLEASGSGLGPDDEDGDDDHDFSNNNRIDPVPNRPTEPGAPYSVDEPIVKTKEQTIVETVNRPDNEVDVIEPSGVEDDHSDNTDDIHEVYIMNPKHEDRASSFFAQPGVLAAVIGGAVVGLLCAILVVMFIVYRMRKKDEGSYALDEPRRSPAAQAFPKPGAPHHNREFYA